MAKSLGVTARDDEFREINGSACRQDHDRGGFHLARAAESSSGLGRDHGRRARFPDHGSAADGKRTGPHPAGGTAGQTKDLLASDHGYFFPHSAFGYELQYAEAKTSTWWQHAWREAGPILVWITVALTVYSGLGYAWRHRDLMSGSIQSTRFAEATAW